MTVIKASLLIILCLQCIDFSLCSTNLCPMPIVDTSDNLVTIYNTFTYYVCNKNRQTISKIENNIELPCGRIETNGNDLIIAGVYPDTVKMISYVILDPPQVFNSTFELLSAAIVTVGGKHFVFGVLKDSYRITVIKREGYQFAISTEIEYNGIDFIKDTTCLLSGSVVFCSFCTDANKATYVFAKSESDAFTRAGDFQLNDDITDYHYGSLHHYKENEVILFYYGSKDNLSCRLITINESAYIVTQSPILYTTLPKPTLMIYFDAITADKEIAACSPVMNKNVCIIIIVDPETGELVEKRTIVLKSIANGDFSYGSFTRFKESFSIGYAYHYFSNDLIVVTFIMNSASCPEGPFLMEPNSSLTLPLRYPNTYKDSIKFISIPDQTTEGSLLYNLNQVDLDQRYSLVGTYKFEAIANNIKVVIKYITDNERPFFSFSTLECEVEIFISPCHPACNTCTVLGTLDDHKCTSCKSNYYPHADSLTNCYDETTKDPHWILEGAMYQTCSSACKGCTHIQDFNDGKYNTHCTECADNYFPLISLPECRNEGLKEDNILFIVLNQIYAYCHSNCMTCSEIGTNESQKCDRCLSSTDYIQSDTQNCIDQSLIPLNNYYTDYINQILYPCLANCETCSNNLSCNTCKSNLYYYNSQCYITCPLLTFIFQKICVDTCPEGTLLLNNIECLYLFEPENASDDPEVKVTKWDKDNFIDAITDNLFNYTNGQLIAKGDDFVVQLVNKDIQNESYNSSTLLQLSKIYGDECLWKLSQNYSIHEEDIVIIKVDINQTELNIPANKVEFIFFDVKNKRELDYAICKNEPIQIKVPIINPDSLNLTKAQQVIDQGYDPFDASSELFNDLCTRFSSELKTDVTIEKRREDFYQNASFCQNDCYYDGVNLTDMTANCVCESRTILDLSKEEKKNMFISSITANFYVVKCYKLVFDFDYLRYSLGFWVMFGFNILNVILIAILVSSGIKKLKYILLLPKYSPPTKSSLSNNQMITINSPREIQNIKSKKRMSVATDSNKHSLKLNKNRLSVKQTTVNTMDNSPAPAFKYQFFNNVNTPLNSMKNKNNYHFKSNTKQSGNNAISLFTQQDNIDEHINENNNESNNAESVNTCNKIEVKTQKTDKESFCDSIKQNYKNTLKENKGLFNSIYFFVRTKHSIWSTFIVKYFIELRVLKVILFFNAISIDCALNALFYTNEYIDKRYENLFGFELLISIPKSIFSFIIAGAIALIFDGLTSSKNAIQNYLDKENNKKQTRPHEIIPNMQHTQIDTTANIQPNENNRNRRLSIMRFKRLSMQSYNQFSNNTNTNINKISSANVLQPISIEIQMEIEEEDEKRKKVFLWIKLKLSIFCIVDFIIMLLFWYYVTAFCIVMNNSEMSWIYGCLKSLFLSLIVPFFLAFVLGVMKWISIKCKSEGLFTAVEVVQLFF